MRLIIAIFINLLFMADANAQIKNASWLERLLKKNASPLLQNVLNNPDTFRYQVIYTKIDRDKNNKPKFTNYYLNVDKNLYFNPASMVKMPVAFAAMEKLNRLNAGIDKYTTMLTDSSRPGQTAVTKDETAATGLPSVDHYIKKIFVVSDNDAYNRLYEFVGQKTLNETLWRKGYKDTRITRRFTGMTPDENRYTNQIRFVKDGKTIFTQPPAHSDVEFDFRKEILLGNAYMDKDDKLIAAPMDFTMHNNAPLEDLQQMLQAALFPESAPESRRFLLTDDDYRQLYKYMSQLPLESQYPKYDTAKFFDSYTKFFFFRDGKGKVPGHIRSFNKTGWSYGFLTDVCYIVDFKNNIEFMLSGNIYVNSDGILNDNKYEYDQTGYPFFREVGEKVYEYELKRKRKFKPDLNKWKLMYD